MTRPLQPDWTTVVDPADLLAALGEDDVVVVDARFSPALQAAPDVGEAAYRQSHIPGARYAHLDRDLSGPPGSGEGRHPWPSAEAFARVLSRWGVTPRSRVAAYDDAGGALAAARVWCLLRMAGHRRVAVLDGGWAAWRERGFPVDAAVLPEGASTYPVRFDEAALLDSGAVGRHSPGAVAWSTPARRSASVARSSRSTAWPGMSPARSTGRSSTTWRADASSRPNVWRASSRRCWAIARRAGGSPCAARASRRAITCWRWPMRACPVRDWRRVPGAAGSKTRHAPSRKVRCRSGFSRDQ